MPKSKAQPKASACSVPGCGGASYCKGLCGKHYQRQVRNKGSLDARPKREDVVGLGMNPKVSPECLARFQAEAERRGVSLYQIVCETLEAGPVVAR